jgi:segregation and condensation protein B
MSDENKVPEENKVHEVPEVREVPEVLEVREVPEVLEVQEAPEALEVQEVQVVQEVQEEQAPRMELAQLKAVIEALVFASPDPITPRTLYKLLNDEPKEDVKAALEAIKADYADRGGLHIAEVAGGFQITTRPEYHEWVRRLFHERSANKLSVAALESLSVIAYKQPVTAAEIGEIRSVNTSGVLSTLLERHLIKIVGRKNVIGRPFLYGTTKEFLIRFGLNDLGDLPKIEDMAQQLGFEPPSVLMEQPVPEEMLPLEEGDVPEGNQ